MNVLNSHISPYIDAPPRPIWTRVDTRRRNASNEEICAHDIVISTQTAPPALTETHQPFAAITDTTIYLFDRRKYTVIDTAQGIAETHHVRAATSFPDGATWVYARKK